MARGLEQFHRPWILNQDLQDCQDLQDEGILPSNNSCVAEHFSLGLLGTEAIARVNPNNPQPHAAKHGRSTPAL